MKIFNNSWILILVWSLWFVVCGLFLTGCEQVDPETLNKIIQEDPSFKALMEKKDGLDEKIASLTTQLAEIKNETFAKIRMLEEDFEKEKSRINSKISALRSELEPERIRIRQEIEALRGALSNKKAILKNLENTRRNLSNLINQQKAVSVTAEDMAKWQERLLDLDSQIESLAGETRDLEEKLRILRLKLIALRQ